MKPQVLYHYTSVDAFRGIIGSGRIRASDYRYLSGDTQEIQFGIENLLQAVQRHDVADPQRDFRDYLVSFVELFRQEELQIFVTSFTGRQDSRHHWHEYAPHGVSIGFDHELVLKGFPIDISRRVGGAAVESPVRADLSNRLTLCRYSDTLDLPALVAKRFFSPNSYSAMFGKPFAERWLNLTLATSIYQTISSIKRGQYVDDAEFRCVHFNPNPEDYPIKISEFGKPYIELQFDPLEFVRELWLAKHCEEGDAVFSSFVEQGRLRCPMKRSGICRVAIE